MIVKNPKTTKADQRYFEERGKISEAAREGRLGRSWFTLNPKNGKWEVKPHATYKRV